MTALLWMVAGLACAQAVPKSPSTAPAFEKPAEDAPAPKPAISKVRAVTVYQGQALVTREVVVPEGDGIVELVITPMPDRTVDGSLFAEGVEGLRVVSTRFRTRSVRVDRRQEVRELDERITKLGVESRKLRDEITVEESDLRYLEKLEGFTGATLSSLTEKGRLDSEGILALSTYVMRSRSDKATRGTDLRERLRVATEAVEFAKRQQVELAAGPGRVERDAVIVVQKTRPASGVIKVGHLVGGATWTPRYRLQGTAADAPVRLEYLAAVVQETGEDWNDVSVTLSTARPSVDAAPPDLLPLRMDVAPKSGFQSVDATDDLSWRINDELAKPIEMAFRAETSLGEVIAYVRKATQGPAFPDGIPIYVDPSGLQDIDKTLDSAKVTIELHGIPLRTTLRLVLEQVQLVYRVHDGLLSITSRASDRDDKEDRGPSGQEAGTAQLNRDAATGQAEELRVGGESAADAGSLDKDGPSVTFAIAGRLGIPSRRDPQLLEVGRLELPAEYHSKAVPVLTPRVYRLAKLTNTSEMVILPGEATAYVGGEFVGRMRLPLVAAGEPFLVGFGVDPQVQVARRLMKKGRSVQGGNQVFTYEFRIGLRNFRPNPVKLQLWDRLPMPEGESVVVNMVKSSHELSTDAIYLRTARADNLLRWDLVVPPGTVGEKTMYLTYEFRLEYARDLPQPRFLSGGLKEGPIGGGAMGSGMGGMGGMQSIKPEDR